MFRKFRDAKCQMYNQLKMGGQLAGQAGRRPLTRLFIWPVLVVAGVGVAAASGLVWTETFARPGGEIDTFYGLPLSWKENIELVCSPLHPQACQSPIYLTVFDWVVFAIDVLFYIGIGYGLFLTHNRYRGNRASQSP